MKLVRWLSIMLLSVALGAQVLSQASTPEATPEPEATEEVVEPIILEDVDPFDYNGTIVIAGSSTVNPLTQRMVDAFIDDGFLDDIVNDGGGTGAGFERFCISGETDISNASRAIKQSEIDACIANGRTPIEFRVGTDALVVVVSQENTFLDGLTLEEVQVAFSTAQTWADVRAGFPDEPIFRYAAGVDSGTFDFFIEAVFKNDEKPLLAASRLQLSEDDNVLVRGVVGNPYAIGFFGFAYYFENTATLRAIAINNVEPTEETAEDGTYPLARPLFIYSDANTMQEKPQVAAFINYYLTNVNRYILEVGYFPASVQALNTAKENWISAMGR
jgi:phosphate transport system substrate-binding protein